MKTAVEYLFDKFQEQKFITQSQLHIALIKERQQIIDANRDGVDMVIDNAPFITGEQYYNETFNK